LADERSRTDRYYVTNQGLVTGTAQIIFGVADVLGSGETVREFPDVSWFPRRGESAEPAKAICRRCLVQRECVTFALDHPDLDGIWGATRAQARGAGIGTAAALDGTHTRQTAPQWRTDPCLPPRD
jgi:Transcription factor WhiB